MKKLIVTPEGTFEIDLTAEEIAQREQDAIQAEADKLAKEEKIAQEKARKDSAIAKLKALGLTEEEVKSIL
jgi:fructose-1,6-bisphosphatase/sedoheptulose 1,7-bisphosphatase-like protein